MPTRLPSTLLRRSTACQIRGISTRNLEYFSNDSVYPKQVIPRFGWPHIADMAIAETLPTHRTPRLRRHVLPCVLMRAGTSKGMFLHKSDLPPKQQDWSPHLISALGSRGNDPRQIDGVGGGSSTTSKVAVVSPSSRPDADVEWTFVQVAVGKESVDFTGTCGNITSGIAPFAIQEGLVRPQPGESKVSNLKT